MNYYIVENDHLLSTDKVIENLPAITEKQAKEFSKYSSTHTPSLVDGVLVWTEKAVVVSLQGQIAEIDAKLTAIDAKKVRPMSAILAASEGDDTSEDLTHLSELEAQAVALRAQRAELVG